MRKHKNVFINVVIKFKLHILNSKICLINNNLKPSVRACASEPSMSLKYKNTSHGAGAGGENEIES